MTYRYTLDGPIGTRATLGLIALQSDETIEHDLHRMIPSEGVSLLVSRVPSGLEVSTETLSEMKGHLSEAASLFPRPTRFDAVGYGCTSGTAVIGAPVVAEQVKAGCTTKSVTEPVSGLIAACKALDLKTLGFLSPYVEEVSQSLRSTLERAGIATPVFGSFDEAEEAKVARIDRRSIIDAAVHLAGTGSVEGLFLSCTNLRTLDVIEEIEDKTGLTALSSNLVLGWHLARSGGVAIHNRFGRLSRL